MSRGNSWWMAGVVAAVVGCQSRAADVPPEIRYGESVCDACGMIVSDERFATATIVRGDRGAEPRLFDDFNCQINFEAGDDGPSVMFRWVHDYQSRAWLAAADAHYVRSSTLRTPMASGVVAFSDAKEATRFAKEVDGNVLAFRELWAE